VTDRPALSVVGGAVCRGGEITIAATGATSYAWDPSPDLSCLDCPNPIARPMTTSEYRVIGTIAGGCADTAFVTVVVEEATLVDASMTRGAALLPGQSTILFVRTERAIVTDTLHLRASWNPRIAAMAFVRPAPSLAANGWSVADQSISAGTADVLLTRPTPSPVGPGEVIELGATTYLGDSIATEIPFTLATSLSSCALVRTRAGQLRIDSICGLSFRMIETSDGVLALLSPAPNPVTGRSTIRFSTPFDGAIVLSLVDGGGAERVLADGWFTKGEHELVLDATELASGLYSLRLRSGETVRTRDVVVVR